MNWLLEFALRATVLLGLGLCLRPIIGRACAERRVTVLRASLAALVVLPAAMLLVPTVPIPILRPTEASGTATTVQAVPLTKEYTSTPTPASFSLTPFTADRKASPSTAPSFSWSAAALGLWVSVSSLLLFVWGIRLWQIRRLRNGSQSCSAGVLAECYRAQKRLGVRQPVECLEADVRSPLTFGVFRHTILVPKDFASWPEESREAVLIHEAAHIKRFDCAWQWLSCLLRAVYWCHPLVWISSRALRDDSELAADERAVRSGIEATDYAASLIAIARNIQLKRGLVRPQGVTFMQKDQLERRVKNILHSRRRGFSSLGLISLMAGALGTGILIGAARFTTMKTEEALSDGFATYNQPLQARSVANTAEFRDELASEHIDVAFWDAPEEWQQGQVSNFDELLSSMTSVQREIVASRGYLLPEDLTATQKKLLGKLPSGDFMFQIHTSTKLFSLRARRPAKRTGYPQVKLEQYAWDPKQKKYVVTTSSVPAPKEPPQKARSVSPVAVQVPSYPAAQAPSSGRAEAIVPAKASQGSAVASTAPKVAEPSGQGAAVASAKGADPSAPAWGVASTQPQVASVSSPAAKAQGGPAAVSSGSGGGVATAGTAPTQTTTKVPAGGAATVQVTSSDPFAGKGGSYSVSISKGVLTLKDPKGAIKKWRVPEGSTVTLSGDGKVTVNGPDGKKIDLKGREIKQ